MIHSFWAGGPAAYAMWLREHYDAKLRDLRTLLSNCHDESERATFETEFTEIQVEYASKLKEISQLLF